MRRAVSPAALDGRWRRWRRHGLPRRSRLPTLDEPFTRRLIRPDRLWRLLVRRLNSLTVRIPPRHSVTPFIFRQTLSLPTLVGFLQGVFKMSETKIFLLDADIWHKTPYKKDSVGNTSFPKARLSG